MKIVVFAEETASFLNKKSELETLGLSPDDILWCDSRSCCRGEFINRTQNQWLFFIDHDCQISASLLQKIHLIISKSSGLSNVVYCGSYLNPASPSYLQRGHNFIANVWLEQSYTSDVYNKLLLGGVFLIYASGTIDYPKGGLFWGAEDKVLSYRLTDQGFDMQYTKDLAVVHNTSSSILHFLKRAFLHGKNDVKYFQTNKNKINYRFWIRKIGFANLNLLPLILLHFCIQRAAVLFQTAPRLSRQRK